MPIILADCDLVILRDGVLCQPEGSPFALLCASALKGLGLGLGLGLGFGFGFGF
jgi:hypothetical protein